MLVYQRVMWFILKHPKKKLNLSRGPAPFETGSGRVWAVLGIHWRSAFTGLMLVDTLPVVPARGGAEVALKIYITPFSSIELACAVRQPSPCVRALCETGVLFHMSHFKLHFTLHTWQSSHSTLHTALFTLHSSHCTLRSQHFTSHCTLKTPHFTLHTSHSTLHTSHCTLRSPNFTLHTPHFTLHSSHSKLHTSQSTLHTSHFSLLSSHSTLHTSHCTLHAPHFTL